MTQLYQTLSGYPDLTLFDINGEGNRVRLIVNEDGGVINLLNRNNINVMALACDQNSLRGLIQLYYCDGSRNTEVGGK